MPGKYGPAFSALCAALDGLDGLEEYARAQEAKKPKRRRWRGEFMRNWYAQPWKQSVPHGSKMRGEDWEDPPEEPRMKPTLTASMFELASRGRK